MKNQTRVSGVELMKCLLGNPKPYERTVLIMYVLMNNGILIETPDLSRVELLVCQSFAPHTPKKKQLNRNCCWMPEVAQTVNGKWKSEWKI